MGADLSPVDVLKNQNLSNFPTSGFIGICRWGNTGVSSQPGAPWFREAHNEGPRAWLYDLGEWLGFPTAQLLPSLQRDFSELAKHLSVSVNNVSVERDYGTYGTSKIVPAYKRVMKTEFQVTARAFFYWELECVPMGRVSTIPPLPRSSSTQGAHGLFWCVPSSQIKSLGYHWAGLRDPIYPAIRFGYLQTNTLSHPGSYCKPILSFAEMFMGILIVIT